MTDTEATISPTDIESKFTELQQNVENATASARAAAGKIALVVVVVVAILAYVIGRRRGKASKTVVEVRRL